MGQQVKRLYNSKEELEVKLMKKRFILDTNFILSFLILNEPLNMDAIKIFSELPEDSEFIVPQIVAAELSISEEQHHLIFKSRIFAQKFTSNNENDLDYINSLSIEIKKPLKAIDCLILALCKRYNAKLITFDTKLQKAYNNLF
jgi:predicted nucleic acid-binding protein